MGPLVHPTVTIFSACPSVCPDTFSGHYLENACQEWLAIDRSRYYYSHLVAARGRGSRKARVRVVWTNMTKECEVKCKYHWDIVQNKYENLMILHIRIICGEDLFSMGIYHLIKTKIYFTVGISMYVKSSVPACTWLILQRPLTATRWL